MIIQYVFDNANCISKTLDGYNTFRCMGGIKYVTPRAFRPNAVILRAAIYQSTSPSGSFNTTDICRYNKVTKTGLKKSQLRIVHVTK